MQNKLCGFNKINIYIWVGLEFEYFSKMGKFLGNYGEIQHVAYKSVESKGLWLEDNSPKVKESIRLISEWHPHTICSAYKNLLILCFIHKE